MQVLENTKILQEYYQLVLGSSSFLVVMEAVALTRFILCMLDLTMFAIMYCACFRPSCLPVIVIKTSLKKFKINETFYTLPPTVVYFRESRGAGFIHNLLKMLMPYVSWWERTKRKIDVNLFIYKQCIKWLALI